MHISISHTNELASTIISNKKVGLDIESLNLKTDKRNLLNINFDNEKLLIYLEKNTIIKNKESKIDALQKLTN